MADSRSTSTSRIAALEEGYKNLGREIGGIRHDLQTLAGEIRAELSRRSRVQWSPMIAAVAVVITVMGAFAQGPIAMINRNDDAIRAMASNRFTDRDGEALRRALETHNTAFMKELHEMQTRLREIEDEDLNRPEAETMLAPILQELRDQRSRVDDLVKEYYCGEPRDVR